MTREFKKDLSGQQYNGWTVLYHVPCERKTSYWMCRCQCGKEKTVAQAHLTGGKSRNCGCVRRAKTGRIEGAATGMSTHPLYSTWCSMITRCHNLSDDSYCIYGAKGITVCREWRDSFNAFLEHVGDKPTPKHTLDRIDNSKGYEPGNVRWATMGEQLLNNSRTKYLTCDGKTQSMKEWSEELGIKYTTLRARIRQGWPVKLALTEGVKPWKTPWKNAALITFNGKSQNVHEWACEIGMAWQVLQGRLDRKWSVERALTEPVHQRKGEAHGRETV